jgi:hypothetical protein
MKVAHITEPGDQKAKTGRIPIPALTVFRKKSPGLKPVAWLLLIGLLLGTGLAAAWAQGSLALEQGETVMIPAAAPDRPAAMQPTAEPLSTPEAPAGDRRRYVEGESPIIFQWDMLIDSLALAVSYAWLCCGVVAIVGLPVMFVVLWVMGTNRRRTRQ